MLPSFPLTRLLGNCQSYAHTLLGAGPTARQEEEDDSNDRRSEAADKVWAECTRGATISRVIVAMMVEAEFSVSTGAARANKGEEQKERGREVATAESKSDGENEACVHRSALHRPSALSPIAAVCCSAESAVTDATAAFSLIALHSPHTVKLMTAELSGVRQQEQEVHSATPPSISAGESAPQQPSSNGMQAADGFSFDAHMQAPLPSAQYGSPFLDVFAAGCCPCECLAEASCGCDCHHCFSPPPLAVHGATGYLERPEAVGEQRWRSDTVESGEALSMSLPFPWQSVIAEACAATVSAATATSRQLVEEPTSEELDGATGSVTVMSNGVEHGTSVCLGVRSPPWQDLLAPARLWHPIPAGPVVSRRGGFNVPPSLLADLWRGASQMTARSQAATIARDGLQSDLVNIRHIISNCLKPAAMAATSSAESRHLSAQKLSLAAATQQLSPRSAALIRETVITALLCDTPVLSSGSPMVFPFYLAHQNLAQGWSHILQQCSEEAEQHAINECMTSLIVGCCHDIEVVFHSAVATADYAGTVQSLSCMRQEMGGIVDRLLAQDALVHHASGAHPSLLQAVLQKLVRLRQHLKTPLATFQPNLNMAVDFNCLSDYILAMLRAITEHVQKRGANEAPHPVAAILPTICTWVKAGLADIRRNFVSNPPPIQLQTLHKEVMAGLQTVRQGANDLFASSACTPPTGLAERSASTAESADSPGVTKSPHVPSGDFDVDLVNHESPRMARSMTNGIQPLTAGSAGEATFSALASPEQQADFRRLHPAANRDLPSLAREVASLGNETTGATASSTTGHSAKKPTKKNNGPKRKRAAPQADRQSDTATKPVAADAASSSSSNVSSNENKKAKLDRQASTEQLPVTADLSNHVPAASSSIGGLAGLTDSEPLLTTVMPTSLPVAQQNLLPSAAATAPKPAHQRLQGVIKPHHAMTQQGYVQEPLASGSKLC